LKKGGWRDLKILKEAPNPLKRAKHTDLVFKVPFRGFRGMF
jgi:hypothetical protein